MRASWTGFRALSTLLLILAIAAPIAIAQDGPPPDGGREAALRRHARAIEESSRDQLDPLIARFEERHFSAGYRARTTPEQRRDVLAAIRAAAAEAGNVMLAARDDRFYVRLEGRSSQEVEFSVEDREPWGIDSLAIRPAADRAPAIELTRENLVSTFERLEREGLSGVVYVRLDGEVVLDRAFGMANAELGIPVRLDTVFGTGSRPIDYTRAAIYLLEQQGRIRQDDTIAAYFDDVPADKRSMTIRHLMTGRSGLPDFFHTESDRDADLAWIDRAEAERRLLAAPLLFAPGTGDRHSHAAFGLLAALIERVSGTGYESFLREHFFDPAGMTRTGMYGDARGMALADFAVGGGPSVVGVPNIPPNWGPTSWLVMGSGGMYSTLPDLRRFYDLVRSDRVLTDRYAAPFRGGFASVDGSDRGFELFQICRTPAHEAYLLVNLPGQRDDVRDLMHALEQLVEPPH